MKYNTLSIIIGTIGLILFVVLNILVVMLLLNELTTYSEHISKLPPSIIITSILAKVVPFILGVVGIIFGIKAIRKKQRMAIFGICISAILIILPFVPVLDILLANSALDININ